MNNKIFTGVIFIQFIFCSLLLNCPSYSQNPTQSLINISKITSWVSEEGFHDWVVGGSWNGAYPNGSSYGVIFSEGICWGGLVNDGQFPLVRLNGNIYKTGCSPITRLYRVRTDYYSGYLKEDAASVFNKDILEVTEEDVQQLKEQYEKDWNKWPAEKGAPFFDEDGDGIYNPDIDVPGVPEAVQTIWISYNDNNSDSLFASPPIGLEIQETYWAYTNIEPLGNIIYKKVDIIYKGTSLSSPNSKIDSLYICQWSDPDLESIRDDLTGCDTTLNLGYAYNSAQDYIWPPLFHQAVGYSFLQGVSKYTGNYGDSAIFNFKWRKGYKYFNKKPLSVFVYDGYWAAEAIYYNIYAAFNIMRGYKPVPPYPASSTFPSDIADYTENGIYLVTGDPVTQTGKLDGTVEGPGDRRMWLMSGPFNMDLGDTAEVVIALVGGMGDNNLSSITNLRNNTRTATLFYNYFVEDMTAGTIQVPPPDRNPKPNLIPDNYVLYQNFPNPFNSTTTITYELPNPAFVTLIVYDILGKEVSRLVDKGQEAGKYSVKFNVDNLSSGVYFYKITFINSDSKLVLDKLYKVKKMIVIR